MSAWERWVFFCRNREPLQGLHADNSFCVVPTGEQQADHGTAPSPPGSAPPHTCTCVYRHTHRYGTHIKIQVHTTNRSIGTGTNTRVETQRPTHQYTQPYIITCTYVCALTYVHSDTNLYTQGDTQSVLRTCTGTPGAMQRQVPRHTESH